MSNNKKKLTNRIIFRIIATGAVLFAGSTAAEGYQLSLDTDLQEVTSRSMGMKIQKTIEAKSLEAAATGELQQKMMEEGMLINLLQEKNSAGDAEQHAHSNKKQNR